LREPRVAGRSWGGLAPTDRGSATVRAGGRRCPNRGTPSADAWALIGSGRERKRRGTRHVGQPRKEAAWAEPEGTMTFLFYSNKFQTSSNCFDQKVDLPSSRKFN
jgi:hypothetical protein